MTILIVVDSHEDWDLAIPGVEVVTTQAYLTEPRFSEMRRARVFNLARSYRYQTAGYYVSLLAAARRHVPRPSVRCIQDMTGRRHSVLGAELDPLIQKSLSRLRSEKFELSIYFGRTTAKRDARLGLELFNRFEAPLLRARFSHRGGRWQLTGVGPIAASEIPSSHRPLVARFAGEYFRRRARSRRRRAVSRYDLAILWDPKEEHPPCNERALQRFEKAAKKHGLESERITKDDVAHLGEFDALFIRETTNVDHHTYRMARRAAELGLVVIDDPDSILRCTNKVFQAETFAHHGIPSPKTVIVHAENVDVVERQLGFPCVLKQPDGSFSTGVIKVDDRAQLEATLASMFEDSALVLAQEFLRTDYDWRVGVFDGKPLYACKYHMAPSHWQIYNWSTSRGRYGSVDALPIEEVPKVVVRTAIRAAGLIGDGFYGVDLKHVGRRAYVIEVNDNPSVESGYEDKFLGDALYERLMGGMLARIERRARGAWRP